MAGILWHKCWDGQCAVMARYRHTISDTLSGMRCRCSALVLMCNSSSGSTGHTCVPGQYLPDVHVKQNQPGPAWTSSSEARECGHGATRRLDNTLHLPCMMTTCVDGGDIGCEARQPPFTSSCRQRCHMLQVQYVYMQSHPENTYKCSPETSATATMHAMASMAHEYMSRMNALLVRPLQRSWSSSQFMGGNRRGSTPQLCLRLLDVPCGTSLLGDDARLRETAIYTDHA